jgi:hypothetical protein
MIYKKKGDPDPEVPEEQEEQPEPYREKRHHRVRYED